MFSTKIATQPQSYSVYWTERDEWGTTDKQVRCSSELSGRALKARLTYQGHREATLVAPDGSIVRG